ncbi:MAG: redox-regulated ATPase YchF [Candidatus Omnitrophota bacterium]|nr:MAG: redox-regulated ATPase YchF [Candidatus Omnitrophota bacterium]
MKIAIVGFPGCGKSTCFKAITQKTKNETDSLDPTKPHLGTVKILDQRLERLETFFNPKKLTYAEIVFEDLPGFHIHQIKEVEALMEVLGIFSGSRDPVKDIEDMDVEFMLADLSVIDNRLPALDKELKQDNRREKILERETLLKCKKVLEKNTPLGNLVLTADQEKVIRGFQFLSRKPLFILGNIDENRPADDTVKKMEDYCKKRNVKCAEFPAKLEAEIADLEESERAAFLKELGISQAARDRVIKLAYDALGYITFFTVKGSQTKAWPVKNGTTAIEAAGKIHSDIQKGFIKAETINFDDLIACGSMQGARKKALLKLEGKEYRIKDGDIIDFRFSV